MINIHKLIGTLVPLSALYSEKNSEHDKGTIAAGMYFLDWLHAVHQSAWQMLPLYETQLEQGSPVKHVPSPYKGYGIGLDPKYLPEAYTEITPSEQDINKFISANNLWIHDYAVFCALRDHFQTDDWNIWDIDVRKKNEEALVSWKQKLKTEIDKCIVTQWRLSVAYRAFRKKAAMLGVYLIGDLPFYLSLQSPLVWAHQDVFDFEDDGRMRFISGVPNIANTNFGRQIWGHPLYKWGSGFQTQKVIEFWQIRLRCAANLFDIIRFDHAKAFFEYCAIDSENKLPDAYRNGPGAEIFEKITEFARGLGLKLFAEDAGENLQNLRASLNKLNMPGLKVFRFSLPVHKEKINIEYIDVTEYPENTVAYTTTHDTETLISYLNSLTPDEKQNLAANAGIPYNSDDKLFAKILRDAILSSPASMVIIPIQDWLLTTDRINVPGTELPVNDPNWHFKLQIPIEKLPIEF